MTLPFKQRVSNIDLPNKIEVFWTYLVVMLANKKTTSFERDLKV